MKHVKFLQIWTCLNVYLLSNECSLFKHLKAWIFFVSTTGEDFYSKSFWKFSGNFILTRFLMGSRDTWRHDDVQKNFQNEVGMVNLIYFQTTYNCLVFVTKIFLGCSEEKFKTIKKIL